MTVGELFAGIGGFGLGFERAGYVVAWQVEREKFCNAILKTRFPGTERFEDVKDVGGRNLQRVDVICAGVPCQDVSIAGRRAGLAGQRTGLFYEFARILQELRPPWFVFENVPGLFTSNNGRDFAEVLRVLMAECGYGVAWRVLNSQFFGVAQRRQRVFIVGSFGRPCPAEILFEPPGSGRNFETDSEAGTDIATPLGGGARGVGRISEDCDDQFIVRQAINSKWAKRSSGPAGDEHHNLVATALSAAGGRNGRTPRGDRRENLVARAADQHHEDGIVAPLNMGSNTGGFRTEPGEHLVAPAVFESRFARNGRGRPEPLCQPLKAESGETGKGDSAPLLCAETHADGVRDFAGLPEGLDSPRYRALGNAVTVQVSYWIAQRIRQYHEK